MSEGVTQFAKKHCGPGKNLNLNTLIFTVGFSILTWIGSYFGSIITQRLDKIETLDKNVAVIQNDVKNLKENCVTQRELSELLAKKSSHVKDRQSFE